MLEQHLTKTLLIWCPSVHTLSYIPIPLLIENIDIHRAPSHKLLALNFHCIDLAHQYEWGLLCVCSSPSVRRLTVECAFPRTHTLHSNAQIYWLSADPRTRARPCTHAGAACMAWQTATARLTSPLFTKRCALCPSTPLSPSLLFLPPPLIQVHPTVTSSPIAACCHKSQQQKDWKDRGRH